MGKFPVKSPEEDGNPATFVEVLKEMNAVFLSLGMDLGFVTGPEEPSISERAYNVIFDTIYIVFRTVITWLLLIPIAIARGIKDAIEASLEDF